MTIPLSPMDYYFFRPNLYTIQFVFEYLGDLALILNADDGFEVRFKRPVE